MWWGLGAVEVSQSFLWYAILPFKLAFIKRWWIRFVWFATNSHCITSPEKAIIVRRSCNALSSVTPSRLIYGEEIHNGWVLLWCSVPLNSVKESSEEIVTIWLPQSCTQTNSAHRVLSPQTHPASSQKPSHSAPLKVKKVATVWHENKKKDLVNQKRVWLADKPEMVRLHDAPKGSFPWMRRCNLYEYKSLESLVFTIMTILKIILQRVFNVNGNA